MPIFDYRGADGRALLSDAYELGLWYTGNFANAGWRALTAEELGVASSHVDSGGFFTGEGLLDAQANILAKVEDGRIVKLAVAYTATNNGTDVADYSAMADDSYCHAFDYLLEAVRTFAIAHGISGREVLVTGYSLGAGAANTMAAERDDSWGGFYRDSDYLPAAVPKLTEVANVFNFGFENDVVHRVTGEGDKDANADSPTQGIVHNDVPYATTTDNIVLFNDTYANPLFPVAPFTLANVPEGWSAHLDGTEFNPVRLISGSHFYDYMEMDSTIVIAYLTEQLRGSVWVEDKQTSTSSHFGSLAFILGGDSADRLGDGRADDFLDGFGGDDLIRISRGNDAVHGGSGTDTVIVAGSVADYDVVRLADGTVYLHDRAGIYGLDELVSVERLKGDALLSPTYAVTRGGLDTSDLLGVDIGYVAHREGGAVADTLRASAAGERLFGLGGDDRLVGGAGDDLLVGGTGRDLISGGLGRNAMFGGAGNDHLLAGAGDDALSGGVGGDLFDFAGGLVGEDRITDFDMGEQGDDRMRFSRTDFADFQALVDHSRQVGEDLVIDGPHGAVTLVGYSFGQLTAGDVLFG